MKGAIDVLVQNNRVQYKFTIKRNITILCGNSATGKTTLIEMIDEYRRMGTSSGIQLSCKVPCRALSGDEWEHTLKKTENSIVFIDEDNAFVTSYDFASAIRNSSNYYVIAMREGLAQLPYSVDEIYGIRNLTKGYGKIKRIYSGFKQIYTRSDISWIDKDRITEKPDIVIAEDSNAGFTFLKNICDELEIPCVSAGGKSGISSIILEQEPGSRILVIADGAAFGSEIAKITALDSRRLVAMFLPESFEWLILNSGILKSSHVNEVLLSPEDYVESSKYFSWEQFFTALLSAETEGTYLQYNKRKLNEAYLQTREKKAISTLLPLH